MGTVVTMTAISSLGTACFGILLITVSWTVDVATAMLEDIRSEGLILALAARPL